MGFIIGGRALFFFYPAESDYLLTATRFKPHILIYTSATDWVGNNTDVSLGDFFWEGGGNLGSVKKERRLEALILLIL